MAHQEQATKTERAITQRLGETLEALVTVHSVRYLGEHDGHPAVEFVIDLQGQDSGTVFEEINRRLETLGYTPTLRRRNGDLILQALPVVANKQAGKIWVNAVLFILTVLSVIYIGALNEGGDPLSNLSDLRLGLSFAATLLGILTAHELSHYFVGRRYGSPVSLPYFIPLPFNILGTMGAVITSKGPMRSRKALFDIGVAGPIGGVIVAIPLLFLGLALSNVQPLPQAQAYLLEGNSLLYYLAKWLVFGRPLPSAGMDVMLHPVAFAAWAGLMVTALNLVPVGQLDGGHVTYAMFGKTAWTIARGFVALLIGWGLLLTIRGNASGMTWVLFGGLGLLIGPKHPAPLDDVTPLGRTRRLLGWAMVLLFVLTMVPVPLTIFTP